MANVAGECVHCGCARDQHWPGPPESSTAGCKRHRDCDHFGEIPILALTAKPIPFETVLEAMRRIARMER